eukprot:TRINITY_DN122043_c0_g1_i1.p1 TRINITY_DN122043_c0_g1~~TRINITY_DN122043_c0_g1_i1.p1  ORF type:complete len:971 (+),score=208.63 TRINITY_DN122043_c0_g1_i1:155-3067(+)
MPNPQTGYAAPSQGQRRPNRGGNRHAGANNNNQYGNWNDNGARCHGAEAGAYPHHNKNHIRQAPPADAQMQKNNKSINRQVTRAADTGDLNEFFRVVQQSLAQMNGINLATSLHRAAKLAATACDEEQLENAKRHPVMQALFDHVVRHVCNHSLLNGATQAQAWEMPAQCISIVAWSCATLRIRHKSLLEAMATISAPRLGELKPFELSNLVWSYAKLSLGPLPLFKAVSQRLQQRYDGEFKVQCLSTVAWAFATLRQRNSALFGSLARELVQRVSDMKPQEISNTLWAFAKSQAGRGACQHQELFLALGQAALAGDYISNFKSQELSNSVWAFATAGLRCPQFFAATAEAVIARRHELAPQHIANILWAFARSSADAPRHLFPALLDVSVSRLQRFKPQELSASIWAASQMCPEYTKFFGPVAREAAQRIHEFTPNAMANLAIAFASPKVESTRILEVVVVAMLPHVSKVEATGLCKLLQAVNERSNEISDASLEQLVDAVEDRQQASGDGSGAEAALADGSITKALRVRTRLERALQKQRKGCKGEGNRPPAQSIESLSTCDEETSSDMPEFNDDWVLPEAAESKVLKSVEPVAMPLQQPEWVAGASLKAAAAVMPEPRKSDQVPKGQRRSKAATERADEPWHVRVPDMAPRIEPAQLWSQPISIQVEAAMVKPTTTQLRVVDSLCLVEVDASWQPRLVNLALLKDASISELGLGGNVHLRQGLMDQRVTLRKVPLDACLTSSVDSVGPGANFVLKPLARVLDPAACVGSYAILAYSHCAHGSLKDWLDARLHAGHPVTPAEAARIVHCIMLAAVELLDQGCDAVGSVQPSEIYMAEGEVPKLRAPLKGSGSNWLAAMKWISPEEAVGRVSTGATAEEAWPALAYRLGLLLHCLNSNFLDPFPALTGEQVLVNVLAEARSTAQGVRPEGNDWSGPLILRQLVASLMDKAVVSRSAVSAILEAVAATAA